MAIDWNRHHGRKARIPARLFTTLLTSIALALGLLTAPTAFASPVMVDPGGFTGTYVLPTGSEATGPSTVDLVRGPYSVTIPFVGTIDFEVDDAGSVTVQTTDAATATGNTLAFRNVTVAVNPGRFPGQYVVRSHGVAAGVRTYVLVPGAGMRWDVTIPFVGAIGFQVDDTGSVTVQTTDAATGGPSLLAFRNVTVAVDPGRFPGQYVVRSYSQEATGVGDYVLVPGAGLQWDVTIPQEGNIDFRVDASANVTVQTTDSATATGNRLTFRNVTLYADPCDYAGLYELRFYLPGSGLRKFVVVPGARITQTATVDNVGFVHFTVLAPCMISSNPLHIGDVTLTLSCAPACGGDRR